MQRKSQSISINTIIIAAIALAVLVVLFLVFTGRFKMFSEGVRESALTCDKGCKAVGYSSGSVEPEGSCASDSTPISGGFEDVQQDEDCCCRQSNI